MQALDELKGGAHQHGVWRTPTAVAEASAEPPDESSKASPPDTFIDVAGTPSHSLNNAGLPSSHSSHPRVLQPSEAQNRVSVARAEHEFAELSRQLSNQSQDSRKLSHQASKASGLSRHSEKEETDLEKAPASSADSEEERWDLEQTLRGTKDEDVASGIKSKRIGVIWEGLTVRGIGGVKNIVKTFPQAFVSFFNVVETAMHMFGYGKKGKEFAILKDFRGVVKPGEMGTYIQTFSFLFWVFHERV